VLLWLDHGSVERGNRLFRDGDLEGAEQLYRTRATGPNPSGTDLYNLGTVLLGLSPEEAETFLGAGAETPDSAAAHRAHYNLGYLTLIRAIGSSDPEQSVPLLRSSVGSSREALLRDPESDDTRWNLALAQRMLDSLTAPRPDAERRDQPGEEDLRIEDTSLTRSESGEGASGLEPEDPREGETVGTRQAAQQGAREAWTTQDPGPLAETDARFMLQAIRDDPLEMIRGLLWSRRPDVQWWNNEPYPGGAW